METDKALDPIAIAAFGPDRVVLHPENLPDLIHQFKVWIGQNRIPLVCIGSGCVPTGIVSLTAVLILMRQRRRAVTKQAGK
jgi:hypothetical protein